MLMPPELRQVPKADRMLEEYRERAYWVLDSLKSNLNALKKLKERVEMAGGEKEKISFIEKRIGEVEARIRELEAQVKGLRKEVLLNKRGEIDEGSPAAKALEAADRLIGWPVEAVYFLCWQELALTATVDESKYLI